MLARPPAAARTQGYGDDSVSVGSFMSAAFGYEQGMVWWTLLIVLAFCVCFRCEWRSGVPVPDLCWLREVGSGGPLAGLRQQVRPHKACAGGSELLHATSGFAALPQAAAFIPYRSSCLPVFAVLAMAALSKINFQKR